MTALLQSTYSASRACLKCHHVYFSCSSETFLQHMHARYVWTHQCYLMHQETKVNEGVMCGCLYSHDVLLLSSALLLACSEHQVRLCRSSIQSSKYKKLRYVVIRCSPFCLFQASHLALPATQHLVIWSIIYSVCAKH